MEKTGKATLEETLATLRASLSATEGERDRFKGLFEGIGSGATDAQGKVTTLTGELDAEKRISARALAQVELLNQQIAALRLLVLLFRRFERVLERGKLAAQR